MPQTVTVSIDRHGNIFDLDTACMTLGKTRVDMDALPEKERTGVAKRMLGSSVLYCYIGSFADALRARGAEFESIAGTATVTAGQDGEGRSRVLGIVLDISVCMDEKYHAVYEHVARIMQKGCLISASLEPAFPITYHVALKN